MDVASKQHKSQQDSIYCKFVMWSNDKLLHIANVEQFVIDPHDKFEFGSAKCVGREDNLSECM